MSQLLRTIVCCTVCLCASAAPLERQKEAATTDQPADSEIGSSEKKSLYVKIAPAEGTEARAQEQKAETEAKRKADADLTKFTGQLADYTKDLATYTLGLILIGSAQFLIFVGQLIFIWRQESAIKTIERAYVKWTLRKIVLDPSGNASISSEVKNWGKTPAQVTDVLIFAVLLKNGDRLSAKPVYAPHPGQERTVAFLVSDEVFLFNTMNWKLATEDEAIAIQSGQISLVIYGYVEYLDRFKRRHRGGFARRYRPNLPPMADGALTINTGFVSEEGYNYDRKHQQKEG